MRVLLDATGSEEVDEAPVRQMRQAGCEFVFFHKKPLCNIGVLNDRTHRKLAVIDGHEALVGSHCVAEHWLGDAQDKDH